MSRNETQHIKLGRAVLFTRKQSDDLVDQKNSKGKEAAKESRVYGELVKWFQNGSKPHFHQKQPHTHFRKWLFLLVPPRGFEPPTSRLGRRERQQRNPM